MYTVPFDIALSHFTQRYTICVCAVPFDITLSHLGREFPRKLCDPLPQYDFIVLAVCVFSGFGEIAFTSRHKQAPRFATNRNISCNAKQFNAQIELLMFCKAIRHNATPFICILYHSTLR